MSAIVVAGGACGVLAAVCWGLTLVTREYGWVDRLWSIAPVGYAAWFCLSGPLRPRLILMAALIAAWGGRLTYNFYRKGGYARGGEDYRWAVMRAKMGPTGWQLFNFGFIAVFQNALLLALTLPLWTARQYEPASVGPVDVGLAVVFVVFLIGETVADQQQWNFHANKLSLVARGEPIERPFCTRGLWAYSRHPNFFCEMGMWWTIYGFAVAAGAGPLSPSIVGALGLTAIFMGSTSLTESISASKYPGYAEYQRRVSRLIPWPPRRRSEAGERSDPPDPTDGR